MVIQMSYDGAGPFCEPTWKTVNKKTGQPLTEDEWNIVKTRMPGIFRYMEEYAVPELAYTFIMPDDGPTSIVTTWCRDGSERPEELPPEILEFLEGRRNDPPQPC